MSKPLVTIITPVYNCEKYIEQTIRSVLSQGYDRLQYIILDDGSTDGTPEILRKYELLDNVFVDRHDNIGEARTVNRGLRMADGDLIAIVNADDPLLPHCINTMVQYAEQYPWVFVFYCDWLMINEDGDTIRTFKTFPYSYRWMIEQHYCIPGPGAFISRKAIDMAGVRPEKYTYMSDLAHWMQVGLYGDFMRVPYILATFRRSPQQQSQAKAALIVKDHIKSYEDYFKQPNVPKEINRAKSMSAAYFIAAEVSAIADDYFSAVKYTVWSACLYPPNFVTRIFPATFGSVQRRLMGMPIKRFHSQDTVVSHP